MNTHKIIMSKQNEIFNGSFNDMYNAMFSMAVLSEQNDFGKHCCLVTHICTSHTKSCLVR